MTKLFYDCGWRGVNIEPSPLRFPHLVAQRSRDVNLQVAISDKPGQIAFYDQADGGLGTTVPEIAASHSDHGVPLSQRLLVETMTLTEVCDLYAPKEIHFLKVDVEGAEAAVLRSLDFTRYRPWILCIESHFPLRTDHQTFDQWHDYVADCGYRFVFTDTINRYYIAEEHKERSAAFAVPIDFYTHFRTEQYKVALEERVRTLEEKLRAIERLIKD